MPGPGYRPGHRPAALRRVPPPEPLLRHLLGATLRDVRTAQGRTLQQVADRARVSMPYLSEVERGRKEASSEVLAAVARALGLRLADLLSMALHEVAGQGTAGQGSGGHEVAGHEVAGHEVAGQEVAGQGNAGRGGVSLLAA